MKKFRNLFFGIIGVLLLAMTNTSFAQVISSPTLIEADSPLTINYNVTGDLTKKVTFDLDITSDYANLSLLADTEILLDYIDIPNSGNHQVTAIVQFQSTGNVDLKIVAFGDDITINSMDFSTSPVNLTEYQDISVAAGLDRVISYKYAGPCVADVNNDGYYELYVINHNDETNKLYWNDGDGTVTKDSKMFARWHRQDLHGASMADYDNDGDLDIIQTRGGGNGTNPSLPDIYRNDDGEFILVTGDVGITAGARGRGAKWLDMDSDGDLDLMLHNAPLTGVTPVHLFYKNDGNGKFELVNVDGIENVTADRVLVTDVNNDQIDDLLFYGWNQSLWIGNGDFTFTNASSQLPGGLSGIQNVSGVTNIDIDNDGDLDLYFARGYTFGIGAQPTYDFDILNTRMDFRVRHAGSYVTDFRASGDIEFVDYENIPRGGFDASTYKIYLGSAKTPLDIDDATDKTISALDADGWPTDYSESGIYIGHLGSNEWKAAVVINGQIFWNVGFGIKNVESATPLFTPLNRNLEDLLLRNDGGSFTDVSSEWNIPQSGGHTGVSSGDLNNDGYTDLFVHRWGNLSSRPADYMLLNTGSSFEITTTHEAIDRNDPAHGDMGQIFDFDLDGNLDMLNGSDEIGMWYLYDNLAPNNGNYALVRVGYAPQSNIDPMGAVVEIVTPSQTYRRRVGSSGEIYSQSLLNTIHVGLGSETEITSITVTWRDGEQVIMSDKTANQLFDTDNVDPVSIALTPATTDIRIGTTLELEADISPINANKGIDWSTTDNGIISVDENGIISAVGSVGQMATITASSKVNNVEGTSDVTIVAWFPVAVASVDLPNDTETIIEGEQITLSATVLPKLADNKSITWESSDESIATVDASGVVTSHTHGVVTITARSTENNTIFDTTEITVRELIAASVTYDDASYYQNTIFDSSQPITVTVNYNAGTGNVVTAGDFTGIRFYFRQLTSSWVPAVQDITIDDKDALGTESGTATVTFDISGVPPTSELATGNFYFLHVVMNNSAGEQIYASIAGLKIVSPTASSEEIQAIDTSVGIYPNPGYDIVYFSNVTDADVEFYDSSGKLQLRETLQNGQPVSIVNLAVGTYTVRIIQRDHTETLKFIKE